MNKKKRLYDPVAEEARELAEYTRLQEGAAARFPYADDEVSVNDGGYSVVMTVCETCGAWVSRAQSVKHHLWHEGRGE